MDDDSPISLIITILRGGRQSNLAGTSVRPGHMPRGDLLLVGIMISIVGRVSAFAPVVRLGVIAARGRSSFIAASRRPLPSSTPSSWASRTSRVSLRAPMSMQAADTDAPVRVPRPILGLLWEPRALSCSMPSASWTCAWASWGGGRGVLGQAVDPGTLHWASGAAYFDSAALSMPP